MREIKFRAWKDDKLHYELWPRGDYFTPCNPEKGEIYMQYTGLKDKNGKEIYEFDQLKGYWDVVNDVYLGTVEFYGGAFRIKETGLPLAWADKDRDCEVVGNKFDGLQKPIVIENNTLTVEIPKGYKTLDTREFSEGDRHWVEIDLMKEEDMCKIHLPHYPCDKCDKAEKIQKGAKKFAKDFEGVMKDLSME